MPAKASSRIFIARGSQRRRVATSRDDIVPAPNKLKTSKSAAAASTHGTWNPRISASSCSLF